MLSSRTGNAATWSALQLETGPIVERLALLEEHDRAIQEQLAHPRAQQQYIREKIRWYRSVSPVERPER